VPGSTQSKKKTMRMSRWVEYCLWLGGLAGLGYCAFVWVNAEYQQREGNSELDSEIAASTGKTQPAHGGSGALKLDVLGRIDIPRLHMSTIIFEGTDKHALDRGVGHLANTAFPGRDGNIVLAAHRDTFFRALRNIQKGDIISIRTAGEADRYVVQSIMVVTPNQTQFLKATYRPTLTLVTCFPFYYLGPAPKRFIVQADRVAVNPSPGLHVGHSWD